MEPIVPDLTPDQSILPLDTTEYLYQAGDIVAINCDPQSCEPFWLSLISTVCILCKLLLVVIIRLFLFRLFYTFLFRTSHHKLHSIPLQKYLGSCLIHQRMVSKDSLFLLGIEKYIKGPEDYITLETIMTKVSVSIQDDYFLISNSEMFIRFRLFS